MNFQSILAGISFDAAASLLGAFNPTGISRDDIPQPGNVEPDKVARQIRLARVVLRHRARPAAIGLGEVD